MAAALRLDSRTAARSSTAARLPTRLRWRADRDGGGAAIAQGGAGRRAGRRSRGGSTEKPYAGSEAAAAYAFLTDQILRLVHDYVTDAALPARQSDRRPSGCC